MWRELLGVGEAPTPAVEEQRRDHEEGSVIVL